MSALCRETAEAPFKLVARKEVSTFYFRSLALHLFAAPTSIVTQKWPIIVKPLLTEFALKPL